MTTNSLLRVIVPALAFTAACKSDFQAGINENKDGSVQEAGASQDGVSPTVQDSGPPASSVPWSCDPFSPTTKPITLANVLGAGQDTDGTLYVVDQPQADSEQRVFVSSSGTLQRQRVAGSGTESSGGGVMSYSLSVSDHLPPFMLKLETNAAGPTAMGVLQNPPLDIKTFTIGQQGSVLTLVSASQVAALLVANIPAETVIEYNATLSDGRALLVVRPRDDWTYQDFRVFFGAPDHMVERTVDQVVRNLDGGSTIIYLTIDGAAAAATFPVQMLPKGPPSLGIGTTTSFQLTLGPIASPPAGYSYFCLGNPPVDGGVDALSTPADGPAACRGPSPDYGPTSTFPSLPMDTPAPATTCPAACGASAWRPDYGINIDIALPYGACAAGTPSCSALGAIPCACGASSGPVDGFNCSCEGGTWICRIVYFGTAVCMPCPDAGGADTWGSPADGDAGTSCDPGATLIGASYDLSKSRFAFGSTPVREDASDIARWVGSDGVVAIWSCGAEGGSMNGGAPETYLPDWSSDSSALSDHVRAYLVSMGVEPCQIADTQVEAGTDGYTISLVRGVDGIAVGESIAYAKFDVNDQTTSEGLYWPSIPAETVASARAFRDLVADPVALAAYKAKLPATAQGNGVVIIHHSRCPPLSTSSAFQSGATYDVSGGYPWSASLSFDINGNPVSTALW